MRLVVGGEYKRAWVIRLKLPDPAVLEGSMPVFSVT